MLNLSIINVEDINYYLDKLLSNVTLLKSDNKDIDINIILDTINELDKIISSTTNDFVISNEGLVTKTIFTIIDAIVSYFNKVVNNIRLMFNKELNLSELDNFHKKNKMKIGLVLRLPYTKVAKVMVPNSPTYLNPIESIKVIKKSYKDIKIDKSLKEIPGIINTCIKYLEHEYFKDFTDTIKSCKIPFNVSQEIKSFVSKNISIPIKNIAFGQMFGSLNDLKYYDNECLSLKDIGFKSKDVLSCIEDINKKLDNFLEKISEDDIEIENTKMFVTKSKEFSNFINKIARYFEGYGFLVKIYTHHEHHICQIYNELFNLI